MMPFPSNEGRFASAEASSTCTQSHQGSANVFEGGRGGSEVKLHVSWVLSWLLFWIGVRLWCGVVSGQVGLAFTALRLHHALTTHMMPLPDGREGASFGRTFGKRWTSCVVHLGIVFGFALLTTN